MTSLYSPYARAAANTKYLDVIALSLISSYVDARISESEEVNKMEEKKKKEDYSKIILSPLAARKPLFLSLSDLTVNLHNVSV